MNKFLRSSGIMLLCVGIAGCTLTGEDAGQSIAGLPGCASDGTLFPSSDLETMARTYHETVAAVIQAHQEDTRSGTEAALQCTAGDYRSLLKPSRALADLAATLPEFGASRAQELSEADLGAVLLEYLRVYECALQQRNTFLRSRIVQEQGTTEETPTGETITSLDRGTLTKEQERQSAIMEHELSVSRPALERTLTFLGGMDRLRPLGVELECLKRASLDLRNTLGLAAEAASCMPKIWDARGSLRDLTDH